MKTIVHVNQHAIRKNIKAEQREPVLTVKTYKSNTYAHEVALLRRTGVDRNGSRSGDTSMTRDEIVKIAWDVGLFMRSHQHQDEPTKIEQFAKRVAAHERERCCAIVFGMAGSDNVAQRTVEKIREGQA